ncbi:MAG: C_GCAxxG_C_C family protein [Bacteroidetes bacterium]|nr:C_GCAxxG_C_C family protein [Bacteroidota bacterium]
MEKVDKAVQYFTEGFNCSQAVFTAIVENSGIEKESALKIAAGFGGGIARMQKTCGAVTGAVMALGYLNGNTSPSDDEKKEKVYEQVQVFVKHFTEKHGTIKCSELLGCSLQTAEDRQKAKELKLFETVCRKCVADAVNILEEITGDPGLPSSKEAS